MITRTWHRITSPMWISLDSRGTCSHSSPLWVRERWGNQNVSTPTPLWLSGSGIVTTWAKMTTLCCCKGHAVVLQPLSDRFPCLSFQTFALQFHLNKGDQNHTASLALESKNPSLLCSPCFINDTSWKEGNAPKHTISLKQINSLHIRQGEGRGGETLPY